MTRTLTACPTYYNGVRMRSRNEARYAAWASQWWQWRYEPFAFADDIGQWRFDFELQDVRVAWREGRTRVFVEVKPDRYLVDADRAARNALLGRIGSAFGTDPDAVCIIEQSGFPGRPVVVRPSPTGGVPVARDACWVEGHDGRLVLALATHTNGWGYDVAA